MPGVARGGQGTHDSLYRYNHPEDYRLYTDHKTEVIYYGEETAIGTLPRVDLIREHYDRNPDVPLGWEAPII